ncbi:MAG: type II secretion system F family protein [Dermatophilaceae bacterium]
MSRVGAIFLLLLAVIFAAVLWPRRPSSRRGPLARADSEEAVARALESVAMCLQAGLTPLQAIETVIEAAGASPGAGDAHPQLSAVLVEVRRALSRGEPAGKVWVRHTRQLPVLRLVAGAWSLTEASGSALRPAMTWSVAQVRAKRSAKERLDAVTAGAKSSMGLMLLLPLSGLPIGALVGVTPRELYGSLAAAISCVLGVCFAGGGLILARGMLRRAVRPRALAGAAGDGSATYDDVADAAMLVTLSLRSGAGVVEALAAVADVSIARVRTELRRVVAAYRWGRSHRDAWSYADPAWQPLASALGLALEHGAAPAEAVAAAGERLAASEGARLEAAAGRAGTFLLVPLAVMFLPSFALTTMVPLTMALVPRGASG